MNFIQDAKGDTSSIRVALLVSLILGGSVIVCGLVGWFVGLKDAVLMVGAGSGMISFTAGAKSWQAQAEYGGNNGCGKDQS
jgi:hypothetical protein